jgi:FtsH-binding integral membrane protein
MLMVGVMFPGFCKELKWPLFIALIFLVVFRILGMFIPFFDLPWVNYLGVGVFSLYVAFDMYRAANMPHTMDNAVDAGLALYLDIVNLFLTILRLSRR